MKELPLHGQWIVRAPVADVFGVVTDFEAFPEHFPKVATAVRIIKQDGDYREMEAVVRSFGRDFKVNMKTRILPGKGFVSDNDSYEFGTSGHEELLLLPHAEGTLVDYTYQVTVHKKWLRVVAIPLLRWYSMKYWKKAVIDRLREILAVK